MSETSTVNVTVKAVDDASLLVVDRQTVIEDQVASGNVLTNDSDVDTVLTVTSFTVSGFSYTAGQTATLAGGTLTLSANGNYTFTPNANWNGKVPQVSYTTNTGSTSTLEITVTAQNDAPIDGNETNTVTEDVTLTVANGVAGDLLNNATDVDGNTLTITGYTIAGMSGTQEVGSAVSIAGAGSLYDQRQRQLQLRSRGQLHGRDPADHLHAVSDGQGGTDTSTLNLDDQPGQRCPGHHCRSLRDGVGRGLDEWSGRTLPAIQPIRPMPPW